MRFLHFFSKVTVVYRRHVRLQAVGGARGGGGWLRGWFLVRIGRRRRRRGHRHQVLGQGGGGAQDFDPPVILN